ncbi:hypothetical protein PG987_006086 [Apiospora arundinis]
MGIPITQDKINKEDQATWVAHTRSEQDSIMFTETMDTAAEFSQQETIAVKPMDFLPCGLRFGHQSVFVSQAECEALHSVVKAYRKLGDTGAASAEFYNPRMIGPRIGPDLGLLGASVLSGAGPGLSKYLHIKDVSHTRDSRAPFQRRSNITPYQERQKPRKLVMLGFMAEREISIFILIPLSMLYGGLHLAAWNYHFPSYEEQWTWRAASLITSVAILAVASIGHLVRHGVPMDTPVSLMGDDFSLMAAKMKAAGHNRFGAWLWYMSRLVTSPVLDLFASDGTGQILMLYACARVFIVVESFIGLRSVL